MATFTGTARAQEAIRERLSPAFDTWDEKMRRARRAVLTAQHAAEDFAAGAALQVRRHPLGALALTAGAGALAGCLMGYVLGRRRRWT